MNINHIIINNIIHLNKRVITNYLNFKIKGYVFEIFEIYVYLIK
jgi:hypothetical protein